MKNLITSMKNPDIKVSSEITEFLSPSKVFLPIPKTSELLITNKKIKKDASLFKRENRIIYSPVSGHVEKIIQRKNYKGIDDTFLEIINDYKENDSYRGSEGTTTILIHDVKKLVKENDQIKSYLLKGKKCLLLNAMEDEPYHANKFFIHKFHKEEILLFLDTLASIYQIPEIKICVKENDAESILLFEQNMETYPNIHLQILPDIYPIANDFFLKKYLKLTEDTFIFHSEEILELYYDIVKMRKKDFLYITLTGDAIENPQVIKVKKGTLLTEVLPLLKFSNPYDLYVNGLLHGVKSQSDFVVLSDDVTVIYFMKKEEVKEKPCIHCGKCNFVCPMKCMPYQSVLSNGKYKSKDCISCGFCTFICPSRININKYLKEEVK